MKSTTTRLLLGAAFLSTGASGFASRGGALHPTTTSASCRLPTTTTTSLSSEAVATAEAEDAGADAIQTDPKEAVKLFGRLAEKYISEYPLNVCFMTHKMCPEIVFILCSYFHDSCMILLITSDIIIDAYD